MILAGCSQPGILLKRSGDPPVHVGVTSDSVAANRLVLATPGRVHVHQVVITSESRSDVMVGRMRFPSKGSFELVAETPFGMHLFTVGFDGAAFSALVAKPLQGKLPADAIGRGIAHTYLWACPPSTPAESKAEAWVLSCRIDGSEVTEVLDRTSLALRSRVVRAPSGERLMIHAKDYAWWGDLWLPGELSIGLPGARIRIHLVGVH